VGKLGIVTNGLVAYFHYKEGVTSSNWNNIAPNTLGSYNGTRYGTTLTATGMKFDGVDDLVLVPALSSHNTGIYELELFVSIPSSAVDSENALKCFASTNMGASFELLALGFSYAPNSVRGTFGGWDHNIIVDKVYKLNLRFFTSTDTEYLYVDDVQRGGFTKPNAFYGLTNIGAKHSGIGGDPDGSSGFLNGTVKSVKIYNRHLTNAERAQNTTVGYDNVGLVEEPVTVNPPVVTITSTTFPTYDNTISDEPGSDYMTVKFKFDQDVTEWRVRALGTSHDNGTLIASGTSVTGGTVVTVNVPWDKLYQEGSNKVNIYGKNSGGTWTPYET
jgi:hypothetical protein